MDIFISKKYLAYLFVLWIAPVVSSIWGAPSWIIVSLICILMIYAGHEWAHVWACKINNLKVVSVNLGSGGDTYILFTPAFGKNKEIVESDIFLAGVVWDSVCFAIASFNAIFYSFLQSEAIPFVFGLSLILVLIFNMAVPGSDWQKVMQRNIQGV